MKKQRAAIGLLVLLALGYVLVPYGASKSLIVRTITVGATATTITMDERTGRAFVLGDALTNASSTVTIINTRTSAITQKMSVGPAIRMVLDKRTGRAFVCLANGQGVTTLDLHANRILRTAGTGTLPDAAVVDEQAGRVFAVDLIRGGVQVLDATSGRLLRTLNGGAMRGMTSVIQPLAVDSRHGRLFTIAQQSRAGANLQGGARAILMFDTRRDALLRVLHVGLAPTAVTVSEGTNRLFVADDSDGRVRVVDATNGRVLRAIAVGPHLLGLAVDERRRRVFIGYRNGVDVLDGTTGGILHTFAVGPRPDPAVVDERSGRVFNRARASDRHDANAQDRRAHYHAGSHTWDHHKHGSRWCSLHGRCR